MAMGVWQAFDGVLCLESFAFEPKELLVLRERTHTHTVSM